MRYTYENITDTQSSKQSLIPFAGISFFLSWTIRQLTDKIKESAHCSPISSLLRTLPCLTATPSKISRKSSRQQLLLLFRFQPPLRYLQSLILSTARLSPAYPNFLLTTCSSDSNSHFAAASWNRSSVPNPTTRDTEQIWSIKEFHALPPENARPNEKQL